MPQIDINGHRCHYQLQGPDAAPVLVLSHALGLTLASWEHQLAAFTRHFRVLRYDTRGHGGSQVTPGEYDVEQLGRDVLALLDALSVRHFHFCGLSLGGLIGQWLGLNAGSRLQKLVLCSTAAKIGTAEIWAQRIGTVRESGVSALIDGILQRWFTPEFAQSHPQEIERIRAQLQACDASGYAACSAAVRDADFRLQLGGIQTPTLLLSGLHDPGATVADGDFIARGVAQGQLVTLDAAHLSSVNAAEAFNRAVLSFLT